MKLQFNLNRDEIFEKLLNGELSEDEQKEIIDAINQDDRLKKEFAISKEIHSFYKNERKNILKNSLKDLEKESEPLQSAPLQIDNKRFLKLKRYSAIAACLLGIVFLGKLMLSPDCSNEDLYAQHFEAYPNVYNPIVRSHESNTVDIDSQIMNFYEQREYKKSVDLYNENYNYTEEQNELNFYMAIAYMKIQDLDRAKEILIAIPEKSKYYEKAKWYLSLCYLNENNIVEFTRIANTLTYKKDVADDIIETLK